MAERPPFQNPSGTADARQDPVREGQAGAMDARCAPSVDCMTRRFARAAANAACPEPDGEDVYDRRWAGDAHRAVAGALAFLTLMTLADRAAGTITWHRLGQWTTLAAMLLLPPRVSAGRGWLAVRGPWGERLVRTDALVSLECSGKRA